jgi:CHAT domain-containing protein
MRLATGAILRHLFWIVLASLLIVGCQTTPPPMSLDEAKKLTAYFQTEGFVPPPRTTADIAAILEQAKPDAAALASRRAVADAPTPSNATATFYYDRGRMRRYEGRMNEAIADISEAVRLSPSDSNYLSWLADLLAQDGFPIEAAQIYAKIKRGPGNAFFATVNLADVHLDLGDFEQADRDLDSARRQYEGLKASSYALAYRSRLEYEQGLFFLHRGEYAAAERSFRLGLESVDSLVAHWDRAWEAPSATGSSGGAQKEVNIQRSVALKRQIAESCRLRGMLEEAEYWVRRSLAQSIDLLGTNAPSSIAALRTMSWILMDQGRYAEAQQLAEIALGKLRLDNPRTGSLRVARTLGLIGAAAVRQVKPKDALDAYEAAAREVAAFPALTNELLGANLEYAIALRDAGSVDAALRIAEAAVESRTRTLGPASAATVLARGFRASFLAASGQKERALEEFRAVVPQLIALSQSASAAGTIDISRKAQDVLGEYVQLLASMRGTSLEQQIPGGVAGEVFRVADIARSGAVQQALIESGARAAISDKALADLARREQDTWYQIAARERVLADAQSLASNQQDSQALERRHSEVTQLRTARATLRAEIERRFPSYARMTEPQPASLDEARGALEPWEALISIYSTESESYVWALRKTGAVGFAVVPLRRAQLAKVVGGLRNALNPNVRTLGEIPTFDVELAYQLYATILKPVEAGWNGAKTLIIVPHGPLAQLPLALLVTRPVAQPKDVGALFSGYRDLPYLVREVAVAQVPSVRALTILRSVPAASPGRRAFVGFGDPWFSADQATEAATEQTATAETRAGFHFRAMPDLQTRASANLAMLPRLPDTAFEVREIAATLQANPATDVFLGAAANEHQVRTMKLDDRRVVMFATHGLVPGDLDGLMQPALALTAPEVASVDGDGLLTMEKIMRLKLDADWVVLSACNTAAGAGAGADAISGLGRAFFYAGARSLLVTHWAVESTSARLLTTTTFRRQAADAKLTRAEALRESMIDLIDRPGYLDPATKRIGFSYAHPVFWAPFSLVGDGR